MRAPTPLRQRPHPAPVTFRECRFCCGRMYPHTFPSGRGRTSTYYRCEECGKTDYITLGLKTEMAP